MQVCLDIHSCIHLLKYTCSHAMHTQACVHVQVCQRTLTSVDMACRHALICVYTHVEPTHILEPPQSQPRPRELSPSVWVPRDPGEVTPVCRKSHCASTHHPQLLAWYNGGSHSTQLCLLSLCFPISYTLTSSRNLSLPSPGRASLSYPDLVTTHPVTSSSCAEPGAHGWKLHASFGS